MSESDHDYALVVMLNESESTGDKLTFTVQKVNQADLDPDQTRVAIIENEGVQTKVALPASLVTPLNQLSEEGDDIANAYLQSVVLQSLESVAKGKPDVIEDLEAQSNDINIVLKQESQDDENIIEGRTEEGAENNDQKVEGNQTGGNIFEDLSVIQNMLHQLKEKKNDTNEIDENSKNQTEDGELMTVQHEDIEMQNSVTNTIETLAAEIKVHSEINRDDLQKYAKVYKCGFCDSSYTTKYSLNIHMRHHTGEKPFKCLECDAEFVRRSYLKYHMQNHTGIKLYQCTICDMSYTSGSSLKNHFRTHTGEKPYVCSECGEAFARKAYLNHHEIVAHKCALPYKCSQCEKVYKTKSSLRMHIKTHISDNEVHPNKCDVCGKTFTRQHDLKRHIYSVHERKSLFKCELCDMSYTAKGSLVVHMRSHTGEKPFQCDLCDAKFARNTYLRIHRLSHENKKPLECEICNTGFTVMSSLKQHMKRHKGEKPFSCDVCDAKFYRQRSVVEHKRVHTGEKPYQCQLCDKKFAWRCDMRRHSKVHALEFETLYSCCECDATFSNKDLLDNHRKTHASDNEENVSKNNSEDEMISEEKGSEEPEEATNEIEIQVVYICEDCGEQFDTGHSLKEHIETEHKVSDEQSPIDEDDQEMGFVNEKEREAMNFEEKESKEALEAISAEGDNNESEEKLNEYDFQCSKDEKSKLAIITRGGLRSPKK